MKGKSYIICMGFLVLMGLFFSSSTVYSQDNLRDRIRERIRQKRLGKQQASGDFRKGDYHFSLEHDGLTRTYTVHIPPIYDGQTGVPLLLALHGNKGTGQDMRKLTLNGFDQLSNSDNFIVVYPDGIDKSWNDGRDVTPAGEKNIDDAGFIRALIENLKKRFNIDPDRVYVTGMSNGAMFSHRLGCELSDIVAAIAPVAGTMPEIISSCCNPVRPPLVIIFHGTKDAYAPYKGGQTRKNGRGLVLSAEDTARYWARKNSCNLIPETKDLSEDSKDGTIVTQTCYGKCAEDSKVVLYTIQDGGHTWPGGWQYLPEVLVGKTTQNINATEIIWEFFQKHPMEETITTSKNYGPGDYDFSLVHEGLTRKYKVHLPLGYHRNVRMPVVIYIHGGGGDMRAAYMDGLDKASDKFGFILAVPEGTGKAKFGHLRGSWNGGIWEGGECCGSADDVGFISKMIDEIKRNFGVDKKRIYATGISNGGLMTNRLACELSNKIAAIATVAPAAVMSGCKPSRTVPVMNIHGTADPCNPYDGSYPILRFCAATGYKRMSPKEVIGTWLKINGCKEEFTTIYQNGAATCISYSQCNDDGEVQLCTVEGMGHVWPSGSQYLPAKKIGPVSYDISFDQIWEFFQKHPMTKYANTNAQDDIRERVKNATRIFNR